MLKNFGIRAYLFLPDEGSCYIFSTQSTCYEFLASHSVIIQGVIQSFFETLVCNASLSYALEEASSYRSFEAEINKFSVFSCLAEKCWTSICPSVCLISPSKFYNVFQLLLSIFEMKIVSVPITYFFPTHTKEFRYIAVDEL